MYARGQLRDVVARGSEHRPRPLLEVPLHFMHAVTDAWVVMPNHVQAIVRLLASDPKLALPSHETERFGRPVARSVATIVRSFKAATTRAVRGRRQERFALDHGRASFAEGRPVPVGIRQRHDRRTSLRGRIRSPAQDGPGGRRRAVGRAGGRRRPPDLWSLRDGLGRACCPSRTLDRHGCRGTLRSGSRYVGGERCGAGPGAFLSRPSSRGLPFGWWL